MQSARGTVFSAMRTLKISNVGVMRVLVFDPDY